MDILHTLLLFGVGLIAGFMNVFAGGGSTLTLPALIFLGLDSASANGTNRIAIIIQNIFAMWGFQQEKVNHLKQSFLLAVFTLPGAVLGAILAIRISDLWFQRILGVIMILIIVTMFFPQSRNVPESDMEENRKSLLIYPALFGIGFYGGFIQVGVGFLLMAALYHILKIGLVKVNVHKVAIVFLYTIPAILVFIATGNINWELGLSLAAGNGAGGWLAARISVKGGEKIIRYILALTIFIMAVKLFRF